MASKVDVTRACLTAAAVVWPIVAIAATPTYRIQDLGTLGGDMSTAAAVNGSGHVAGSSTTSTTEIHAFIFADGTMRDLGTPGGPESFANGVNDLDEVVGRSDMDDGSVHAFVYNPATHALIDLHPALRLVLSGPDSSALSINSRRHVVGGVTMSDGSVHAFLMDLQTSSVQDLHPLVSLGGANSKAYAISGTDRIAGIADDPAGHPQAFVYDLPTGVLVPLGTLGGDTSGAAAINALGQVVGAADLPAAGSFHAFLSNGQTTLGVGDDAGTLGGDKSTGLDVNAAGIVVGSADDSQGRVFASIFDRAQGVRDLETVLLSNPGWVLVEGAAINANGLIVGTGFINGLQHAFLMTPDYPITVTVSGNGTVTSATPAGIDCPGACSVMAPSGTGVTLSASAAAGFLFTGWSGACSGTADCTFTTAVDSTVTATFLPTRPVVSLKVNGTHPVPALVTTTGPMTLTLDISPSAYTAPVSWYWAAIVNGQVLWITSAGVTTTPAPLAVGPPAAIANATLLNTSLPPATSLTAVFILVDGSGSVIAGDAISVIRP